MILKSLTVFAFTVTASADLVIDSAMGTSLDVSHAVGSGDLTSYMVIDFGATDGESVAFSYSWSGPTTPTSNDMIEAIVSGLHKLVAQTIVRGFYIFLAHRPTDHWGISAWNG